MQDLHPELGPGQPFVRAVAQQVVYLRADEGGMGVGPQGHGVGDGGQLVGQGAVFQLRLAVGGHLLLQGVVGGFQLRGALLDVGLQFGAQIAQAGFGDGQFLCGQPDSPLAGEEIEDQQGEGHGQHQAEAAVQLDVAQELAGRQVHAQGQGDLGALGGPQHRRGRGHPGAPAVAERPGHVGLAVIEEIQVHRARFAFIHLARGMIIIRIAAHGGGIED